MAKKNKKSALAEARTRRLERIGNAPMNVEKATFAMLAAERTGAAERVTLDDGSWGWVVRSAEGKEQVVVPTPEMLAFLDGLELEH